jgi:hypothetical protein
MWNVEEELSELPYNPKCASCRSAQRCSLFVRYVLFFYLWNVEEEISELPSTVQNEHVVSQHSAALCVSTFICFLPLSDHFFCALFLLYRSFTSLTMLSVTESSAELTWFRYYKISSYNMGPRDPCIAENWYITILEWHDGILMILDH